MEELEVTMGESSGCGGGRVDSVPDINSRRWLRWDVYQGPSDEKRGER